MKLFHGQTLSSSGVGSAACSTAVRSDTEEEGHELKVDELDKDTYRCTGGCSTCCYSHTPPLRGNSGSDSDDEESDSDSDDEESDSDGVHEDTDTKEKTEDRRLSLVDQEISTILVNLKVSKELLHQANRSLDTVEKHHQLLRDQPDSVTALTDAPSFPLAPADLCGVSAAVGPPSEQYTLFPQGGDDWTENLRAQLLSRDFKLLSEEELSLWLSLYPAMQLSEQSCSVPGLSSGGLEPCSEGHSCYVSAVDDSVMFKKKQQVQDFTPQHFVYS